MRGTTQRFGLPRLAVALTVLVGVSSGCEEGSDPAGSASVVPPPPPAQAVAANPAEPAKLDVPPKEEGPILGRTTRDVRDARREVASGRAVASGPRKITGKDPITVSGNAYVSIVGRSAVLKIDYAIKLYHASNGRYPKDYAEFKKEILDPNGISLPALPRYQKYGYDDKDRKLVILEYPDLKQDAP